jgi:hypothetical protein
MDSKNNDTKLDIDYFVFENTDFYEWAATAPTRNLVEAISAYFKTLKYNIELIDGDADFTDPYFLNELNGIAWNFYELGPWIMEIQDQLNRRASPSLLKTMQTGSGQ